MRGSRVFWLAGVAFFACSGGPVGSPDAGVVDADAGADVDAGLGVPAPGDDAYSIPRDVWAEFDVGRNDGPLPADVRLRVVKAPTRGVAAAGTRLVRYRSDWHIFGSDQLTYAWFVNDQEVSRHVVTIEVRNERWLSVGQPHRLHLDVGGAPLDTDRATGWATSLTDVSDDGAAFCGSATRGPRTDAFRLDGSTRTNLAVNQKPTSAFRFFGQEVLAGVLDGALSTARFDAAGRVTETWAVPDAGATWVLGPHSNGVLARLETGSTTMAAVLAGSTVTELAFDGGVPMAVSDGFVAGLFGSGSTRSGFLFDADSGVVTFRPTDAVDFTVEDVDAVQGVVGSTRRARFSEGYLGALGGATTGFAIATMLETRPRGISRRGDIVGEVIDLSGRRRSFWLEPVVDPAVAELSITPVAEPRNAGIDHACFHADHGPFATVTGEATPLLAGQTPIEAGHVMYTVDVGQRGPHVAIRAVSPGEQVSLFFETRDVIARFSDEQGRALQPTFTERTDRCGALHLVVQLRTPASGPLFVEFDSTASTVKFVFERSWVYVLEGP